MAKAIIFDMMQTLQRFDFARMQREFQKIIKAMPKTRKIPIKRFMKAYFKNYDLYQVGRIKNDKGFCRRIFASFGLRLNEKETAFFAREHKERRKMFIRLAPRLKETLKALKKAGFKLGLLSNGVENWVGFDWRFLRFNPKRFFAVQLYSQSTGVTKPNPRAFKKILAKMRVKAKDTVFVGDNYAHDVLGPKKIGMTTVWLNKKGGSKRKADFAARELHRLLLLKKVLLEK
jgi:HAD superfamily hydrolase (TIGR01509 family)